MDLSPCEFTTLIQSSLWAWPWVRRERSRPSMECRQNYFSSVHMGVRKRLMFQWIWSLAQSSRAWRCCWTSSGFFRGHCQVCRRKMAADGLPWHPTSQTLDIFNDLPCWLKWRPSAMLSISLSSLSVLTLGRPLLRRSLMFSVYLYLATRRLTDLCDFFLFLSLV